MKQYGLDLQGAFDRAGEMYEDLVDSFIADIGRVPSFGDPDIDRNVKRYVEALGQWPIAAVMWHFDSLRYFGMDAAEAKEKRVIPLKPRYVDDEY